jgi:hypothetical protein
MANTILIKRSSTANSVPAAGSLAQGELAINLADGNLFYKNSSDQVTVIASNKFVSVTGNVTGGNINTAGQVSAAGNVTGAFILGNISQATGYNSNKIFNGTSNVDIASTNGSITLNVGSALIGTVSATGVAVTGVVSATGNVTGGNINTAGQVSAAGNVAGANINGAHFGSGAGLSSLTGANVTGTVPAATVAATVTTAAQPNITSVGTLSSVSVTGNVIGGNVNTNTVAGTGLTLTSSGSLNLSATGNVVVNNVVINGLATPAQNADAATKGYVDSVAQGLDVKASVVFATTAALPAFTYNNGASGVGATITANANGALSIDGSSPVAGDRVLIKNEITTNQPYNGIYVVTNAGSVGAPFVLTRATDFDSGSPSGEIPGAFTFVEHGSTLADTGFVCTTNAPVTVGTTNIVWTQFSGAGTYTAGTGLTLTGSAFSVNASQTQITSVGTLGSLAVTGTTTTGNLSTTGTVSATGNVTGGNIVTGGLISATGQITGSQFNGSGAGLTSIPGANVTGTVSSATTATTAGTVTTAAQPNITSVGTLSSLSVTANVTGGNLVTGGAVSATGAVTGAAITGTSLTVSTGNITGGNLILSGAIVDSAQLDIQTSAANANIVLTPNGTGNVNIGRMSASGNITAAAYYGSGAGLTSIPGANVTGTVPTATSATTAGTVTTAAQPNITSVGTLSGLTVTATITGNISGSAASATTAGTVTTAAQPNITSVGTLSSLSVTGNVTGGNVTTAGIGSIATLSVGTFANVTATTVATSAITGALRVAGGVGVVGNIYGGTVYSGGALTLTVDSTVDGGTY